MPNTKTAKKQLINTQRNRARNLHNLSTLKTAVKKARLAIAGAGDAAAAREALNLAVETLYKSATKGIIKKENASRRVSRLMLAFNKQYNPVAIPPE